MQSRRREIPAQKPAGFMANFLEALRSGRVLLMDGAMGTELQRAGLRQGECGELWNLTHPDRVRAIHQAYAKAGAQVWLTNTFQANRVALERAGIARQLQPILRAAVDLAYDLPFSQFVVRTSGPILSAAGVEFGDLKHLRGLEPHDPLLDAILLETCSSSRVRWAVKRLAQFPMRRPVLLSLSYLRNARQQLTTFSGHSPEWFAERAARWGVAALGVNCGRDIGMDEIIEIIRRYRAATELPLFARPNAGTPTQDGERWIYPHAPETMAARLPELLETGVSMVGGCCGTTPEHIAAFRPVIDAWNKKRNRSRSIWSLRGRPGNCC
jgi:5-methyltetrahydrofolate--homocysteine methyltransferase